MDIYIKPAKKATLAERSNVFLCDLADVIAPDNVLEQVKNLQLTKVHEGTKRKYLISVTDMIKAITQKFPNATVNNVGEMETLLEYSPKAHSTNLLWMWVKIIFVSLVLMVGSATAIMGFYSDAQMARVFEKFHELIFGFQSSRPLIIEIPFTIGLGLGIVGFFNHFAGKKITDDPTPIQVQMSAYENEVSDTLINTLSMRKLELEEGENYHGI